MKLSGDEGGRTPYLLNAIQALYQLSYTPKWLSTRRALTTSLIISRRGAFVNTQIYFFSTFLGN